MVNGKVGLWLMIGIAVILPIEKWQVAGLVPVDLFFVLLITTAWLSFAHNQTRLRTPLILAMWLIFIGSLIGTMSGLDWIKAWIAIIQEVYLYLVFLTLVNVFTDRDKFLSFSKAWAYMAAVISILLILEAIGLGVPFLQGGGIKGETTDPSEVGRALGTFGNANAAGGYMLVSFFLLLSTSFSGPWRPVRIALLVLYIGGIVATGSNGAALGLVLGLGTATLYWIAQRKGRELLFLLGSGAVMSVITLIMVLFFLPVFASVLGAAAEGSILSIYARAADKLGKREFIWGSGVDIFTEYPLGIGPNVSNSVIGIGLHSDYVAFMIERGPLGFTGLMVFIGEIFFWLALAHKRSTTWRHYLATGALLGGLISMCSSAATHEVTHGRPVWLFFAIVFLHYKFLQAEFSQVESKPEEPVLTGQAQLDLSSV